MPLAKRSLPANSLFIMAIIVVASLLPTSKLLFCADSLPGRIVLDPGHGGADEGIVAGFYEKEIVLKIAARIKNMAGNNYTVFMTRDSDFNPGTYERTGIANFSKAEVFVSIHAALPGSGRFSVFYYKPSCSGDGNEKGAAGKIDPWHQVFKRNERKSRLLAERICSAFLERGFSIGCEVIGAPVGVLLGSEMPAVAVEIVPPPYKMDEDWISEIAAVILNGLDDFFLRSHQN